MNGAKQLEQLLIFWHNQASCSAVRQFALILIYSRSQYVLLSYTSWQKIMREILVLKALIDLFALDTD